VKAAAESLTENDLAAQIKNFKSLGDSTEVRRKRVRPHIRTSVPEVGYRETESMRRVKPCVLGKLTGMSLWGGESPL